MIKKFEEFITISSVSLKYELTDKDEKSFDLALTECTKIPVEYIPKISDFSQIIMKIRKNLMTYH